MAPSPHGLAGGWGAASGLRSWERPGTWGAEEVDRSLVNKPSHCEPGKSKRKLSRAEPS